MNTQPNSQSFLEKLLSFLKIKAIPRETQQQGRIASEQNPHGTISDNAPTVDWKTPAAAQGIPSEQVGQLFSPGQPLSSIGQGFLAARAYDYPLVANAQVQPRSDEAIKFADLKILADNCELVRLAIETRKDQMMKLQWNIVAKDPDSVEEDGPEDKRIQEIERVLEYPDGEHPFVTWMAMLLDQMLTYDAPCVYPHLNLDGSVNKLLIVDGSTIKRVIDLWGRTPQPTVEMPNPPAYQQIVKGVPFVNFTKQELIYWPFNPRIDHLYGFGPTEQVLFTANMFMRRQSLQLNYFTEGTLPDFFFELPLGWTPDQIDNFAKNYYEAMKGNDAARRHGRMLPAGTKVNQTKSELLKDEFDEWLARVICFAFSLPPTAFVKQMNRASAVQSQEAAIEEGLAPLMIWFQGLMDYIIKTYFGYDDLVFQWQEDDAIDPFQVAQINKMNLESGLLTKNEIRKSIGEDPTEDGDKAFIVSGATIVLLEDVIAGKTAPPDPSTFPPHPGFGNPPNGKPPNGNPPKVGPSNPKKPDTAKRMQPEVVEKRAVKRIDRNRKYVEERRKKLETVVSAALKQVAHDVLKQLSKRLRKIRKSGSEDEINRILAELNLQGFSVIVDPTEELLEQVYNDGGASAMQQIGLDDRQIVAHTNKQAIEYARTRGAELVTSVDDTTRDMLRGLVTSAMEDSWTVDKLADEIQSSAAFGDYRSTMIARTEIAMADVQGNMATYRASGVVSKKQWIKGSEHEIDDECDDNQDDGPIDLEDDFSSGDDAPPAHPNAVFAGSSFVSYGNITRMIAAKYDGLAITLHAGKYVTTIGPNHPLLTTRGMVQAKDLREGDDLIYDTRSINHGTIVGETNVNEIVNIEDYFATLKSAFGNASITITTDDLHGDAMFCEKEVEVVFPKRVLLNELDSCGIERFRENGLMEADMKLLLKSSVSSLNESVDTVNLSSTSSMSGDNIGIDSTRHFVAVPISKVEMGWFTGFAFDCSTTTSLYCNNGFVVSNCVCDVIPLLDEEADDDAAE